MSYLFSLAKKPIKAAVRKYYKIWENFAVWNLINTKPRNLYKKQKPNLNAVQQKIAQELKKKGIAITHIDELFPNQNLLSSLQVFAKSLETMAQVKTNKEFLQFYFDDFPELDLENPFIKLALNPIILDTINAYMNMWSKFYYLTLNKTVPQGPESKSVQSQRWHRDPEDKKMVKAFVYLNDVDENAGPFVYIPETHFEGKLSNLFPPQPPRGSLPPPEEVKKLIPESAVKICTGKTGTIIFCDTRGIHKGGHAISKERVMATLGYSSYASLWPLRYKYPENFKQTLAIANLSSTQHYALDNFYRIGRKVYKF